ncbi:MAG: hypothetical protein WAQ05_24300 [Rubrivivax sp.]
MTEQNRRDFLRLSALSVGCAALTACGGGNDAEPLAGTPEAAPTPESPSPTPPSPTPPAPTPPAPAPTAAFGSKMGAMQFTLLSPTASTTVPYCVGFAFRAGDIPAGSTVAADSGSFQVTPKNVWPDGSLKFAVLAGEVAVSAAASATVTLSATSTATSGTVLTLSNLKSTGITAQVGAGSFGSVSWSGTDWDAPFMAWVSGPVMSSWIYRKPVGSDAHLVAWLEVRLFASGAVEVLPWVENGFLQVAGPTNKSATYTFTLGGTQRFSAAIDLKHHQRTVLVSGSLLSHWLGASRELVVRHDAAYLMSTEVVPTYRAELAAGAGRVAAQPKSFAPLQQGSYTYSDDDMYSTGYQEPIGPLPEHDVLYLVADSTDSATVFRSVVWNGYGAGRYGVHYRDETTNRPFRFSAYPTLVPNGGSSTRSTYTPAPSGGNAPAFDIAHHPSMGYMAYLVTGRFYFMEEALFVATYVHLVKSDDMRIQAKGLVQSVLGAWQTRACAWQWRSLLTAYSILPDDDATLRTEFKTVVQNNIDHYHSRYVGQTANVFGIIEPGEEYDSVKGQGEVAMWQQDFFSAATGWGRALALILDAGYQTKFDAFHAWNAQGVVNRLQPRGSWWYVNPVNYLIRVNASKRPDYVNGTGSFYTVAQAYTETYQPPNTGIYAWMSTTDNVLASQYFPEQSTPSMLHNMQPALAYAVRFGVPGAQAGYERLLSCTNWSQVEAAFDVKPVWSAMPASGEVAVPAWLQGKPVGQWGQISGTTAPNELKDYCGLAWIDDVSQLRCISAAAGGHGGNLTNNRVMALRLDVDTPSWNTLRAADDASSYATTGLVSAYLNSNKPAPRHTYTDVNYIPELGRVVVGGRFWGSGAADWLVQDGFRLSDNNWDAAGAFANRPNQGPYLCARDPSTGTWYSTTGYKFAPGTTPAASSYSAFTLSGAATVGAIGSAFDSKRRVIYHLSTGNGFSYTNSFTVNSCVIDPATGAKTAIAFNASSALSDFQANANLFVTSALTYDASADCYYFYNGGDEGTHKVYRIKPNSGTTWDMSLVPVTGSKPSASLSLSVGGVNTKFYYVSRWRTCVLVVPNQNVYFLRMA